MDFGFWILDFFFNPFGLVQSLMGSHCGGRVPRHKASGVETPYSPSLRDAPRTGILRQALASPNVRRPRCFTKIQVALSAHQRCDQNLKLTEFGVWN
ncbi:MAG: hypothetical protein V7K48_23950 [Nostoc sp.]|uniref:hypothetical protein n=1 Tax=Nostoc sp. TaxID=1180 RepID=UPI002FF6B7AB